VLIICIVHSASTSLQQALGDISGLRTSHCVGAPLRRHCKRVGKGIHRRHTPGWHGIRSSGAVQIPKRLLGEWVTDRDRIYRSPLLPLQDHIDNLRSIGNPVVVHLRDPKSTLEARSRRKGRSGVVSKLAFDDFVKFNDGWNSVRGDDQFLFTEFRELVTDPVTTINRILEHLGADKRAEDGYSLPRRNYTGEGLRALIRDGRTDKEDA
jgi:hypothetical protein